MPYFDPEPKEKLEDLYDFRGELESLVKAVQTAKMVVVTGFRRTGKTSLVKVALNLCPLPSLYLDCRFTGYPTLKGFLGELAKALSKLSSKERRLLEKLKGISGVRVTLAPQVAVEFSWRREKPDLLELLASLNDWALEKGVRAVLVFDEAQELRALNWIGLTKLFAYIYDHFKGVSLVFSGSQFGLLHDFLGVDNPAAPLFGRPYIEVKTRKLQREEALEFLELGFQQHGVKPSQEFLEQAVEKLDGVIGWLTFFGHLATIKGATQQTLKETLWKASALALQELQNFLKTRRSHRYLEILKITAKGATRWSTIKAKLEDLEGHTINDSDYNNLLTTLVKAGYLEEHPEGYRIADPILEAALQEHSVK